MPSNYAHYRFGAELLQRMPPEMRRTVGRFRQLYDMGLHGPDLFYYYDPLAKTNIGKLAEKYHAQTGKAFFERVCRMVRLNPSEGAMAYLYGVLAHYALDSLTHPFVGRMAESGKATRSAIETEFDRFLLEKDGKSPAYLQDISTHMRLTPGECETLAAFYPPAGAGAVGRCVKNMAAWTRFLVIPKGTRRNLTEKALALAGKEAPGHLMTVRPNPACAALDKSLLRLYEMAMDRYMVLLDDVNAHMRRKAPLGTDFSVPFG